MSEKSKKKTKTIERDVGVSDVCDCTNKTCTGAANDRHVRHRAESTRGQIGHFAMAAAAQGK
jgi:hypothetical protein